MSDSTDTRLNRALAGRYEIEREAGHGGMATVYLARDLRHERKVALKVLHPDLAAALGAERFLAEIRTTANLQHPHILPLHDSGEADGFLFYVMPFVEGETLRGRIERGGILPIDEAVRIAREMLAALDYAHRHGVVHRDIKPENVLLHDGSALVADFGIALAVTAAGGQRMTQTGLSLGTPQYMSPEQAMGEKNIDGRADIYATGALLYEMITGEPPFSGASVQAIVAKVMTERPTPPSVVRDTVPAHVEAATLRALAKLPADRFATAAQFAEALQTASADRGSSVTSAMGARPLSTRRARALVPWIIAATAAAVTGWALTRSPVDVVAPVERYEIPLAVPRIAAPGLSMTYMGPTLAISSSGERLAYIARDAAGVRHVYTRTLSELDHRMVPGTEGAASVTVSPDGRAVAVLIDRGIQKVALDGSPPVVLVPKGASAPSWADDGSIYYLASMTTGVEGRTINRVSASDGKIDTVYTDSLLLDDPAAMPGGKGLFAQRAGTGLIGVPLPDGPMIKYGPGRTAQGVISGYLLARWSPTSISALPIDPHTLSPRGAPIPLVGVGEGSVIMQMAASPSALAYVVGPREANELVWVDRMGRAQSLDTAIRGRSTYPSLSPDGTRIAFTMDNAIWIRQLSTGSMFKLSLGGGNYVAWTADSRAVSYYNGGGPPGFHLFRKQSDGSGQPVRILPKDSSIVESLWSPDGKWLVYRTSAVGIGDGDISMVRASADTAPTPLLNTKFSEVEPSLSPDGRWLAFASNETGRFEIYVVPFPNTSDGRWVVSTRGGLEPVWSPRGGELFYRDGDENLVAVSVTTSPTFALGRSQILFSAVPYAWYPGHRMYDVTKDGQRFLMVRPRATGAAPKLVLVKNWQALLKQKAPAK